MLGVGITIEKAAGQTVVVEGDPRTHGFRVLTGALRLYKALPDGRRQVIDFLAPGECFGLIGAESYDVSAEAIGPCALARYRRADLEAALRSNPEFAARLLDAARADLERAHAQMLLLGRKSAEEKIASFLLLFLNRLGFGADQRRIRLPMSRQDVADYLGLTIETVSRTLTRLRQDGLIALGSPQEVLIRRLTELEAMAQGGR